MPTPHDLTPADGRASGTLAYRAKVPLARSVVLLVSAGVACVGAGVVLLLAPQGPRDVGTVSLPAAPVPAATVVAGSVPVEVELPVRGVRAPVVPVATQPSGELTIPDPPTTVGWWTPSALPGGSGGTTVIAGHVDSRVAGFGAFAALRDVAVDEQVVVRVADGRAVSYRVLAVRMLPKAELPRELFESGGPPRLVLITCGGRFDRIARSYDDNVVVYAVP